MENTKNFGTNLESLKQNAMMEEAIASAGISMDTPDAECGCTNKKYCTKHFNEAVRRDHPTPDTEWEKEFDKIPRFWKNYPAQKYSIEYVQANVVHTLIKSLLSSRDTYWKERVRKEVEALKSDEDLIRDNEDVVEYATYRAGRALDLNYKDHQAIAESIREQVLNALDTLLDNLK